MSKKKGFDYGILQRVVGLGMQQKFLFYSVIAIAIVLAIVSVARPKIVKDIVDVYIFPKDEQGLITILLILVGILVAEVVLQFFFVFVANIVAQSVIKILRVKLFNQLIGFNLSYFDRTPNGVLVTRSVSDIETVAQVFNDGILVILGDVLRIIFVVGMMYYINWELATLVILILPLMVLVTSIFQRALKKVYQNERTLVAKLNSFVQERIAGMKIVQLFNREEEEFSKFKAINSDLRQAYLKTVFYFSLLFPVVELISSLALGALIWYGGWFGNATAGDVVAYILFIQMLIRPIRQVAERLTSIQRGLVGAERVFNILDNNQIIENKGTEIVRKIKGEIEFKQVRFSYVPNQEVIKGIDLTINAGETIAFVGATGAGKSTIINLLSRFYDIDSGQILIDGKDIQSYDLTSLRSHIAVVLQDVFLFNTNILDNIVLGNESISLAQVQEAAKIIGLHEFITKLPNGYHAKVSERGSSLSVGQRQLIAFLRAYLYNPEILVLDEATSSIDSESEELIQRATETLTKDRTSIVIAHRLATIKNADRIVVMGNGKILEVGKHEELITKNGQYKALFDAQFQAMNFTSYM